MVFKPVCTYDMPSWNVSGLTTLSHTMYVGDDKIASTSFPGLSCIPWFMLTTIHGSRSVVKDRELLFIMRMISGCEVDTVGDAAN